MRDEAEPRYEGYDGLVVNPPPPSFHTRNPKKPRQTYSDHGPVEVDTPIMTVSPAVEKNTIGDLSNPLPRRLK